MPASRLIKMSQAYNVLPALVLSKNCARHLITRNAGEKAFLGKKSFLLEKAKTKEEKAFQRERELLLQRQSKTQSLLRTSQPCGRINTPSRTITRSLEDEDKWEVSSDTSLYTKQRTKQRRLLNSKPLCSSHESIFPLSAAKAERSAGAVKISKIPRTARTGQDNQSKRFRSPSSTLPSI